MDFVRPRPEEYAPFYDTYIRLVPDGDVRHTIASQVHDTTRLLRSLSEETASRRYAPGKWSVREVVGHLSDTERIMAYRALRIARGDQTALASFDENQFVANAGFDARSVSDLLAEFQAVRSATLALGRSLSEEDFARRGTASGAGVTVRALLYIIAGHELHHVRILRERYGLGT